MASNLVAHHVGVLVEHGMVTRRRSEGDRRRTYLRLDAEVTAVPTGWTLPRPPRVLFVCTANSARSHLAAALWHRVSPVAVASAGTHPAQAVNPGALAAAARHDLPLRDVRPRQLS